MVIFNKVAKCQNEACGLTVWRTIAKKELSDTQLISLLTNGKTGIIKGLISGKTGKPFDADYKTVFDFEQKKGKPGSKRKSK